MHAPSAPSLRCRLLRLAAGHPAPHDKDEQKTHQSLPDTLRARHASAFGNLGKTSKTTNSRLDHEKSGPRPPISGWKINTPSGPTRLAISRHCSGVTTE